MNKKIAIFFSGRIKGYEQTFSHLKSIIDKYNPVFFTSLNQNSEDEYTKTFCEKFNIKNDQINYEKTILPDSLKDVNSCSHVLNTYSMFYHNYKAFCLIEKYQRSHNIHFDVIVKYRAEIHSSDILKFNETENNKLYIPNGLDYGGINDQIAYGDLDVMKKYCELGNGNVEKIHLEKNIRYHPETLLFHHIKSYNISIARPSFSYNLDGSRR
jgi:hypothetical protein